MTHALDQPVAVHVLTHGLVVIFHLFFCSFVHALMKTAAWHQPSLLYKTINQSFPLGVYKIITWVSGQYGEILHECAEVFSRAEGNGNTAHECNVSPY